MQVNQVNDHVTHAVIGAKKTQDFGISDSPEFFHILSSTLYSDQMLAVVRETLCNAWDAHIEAGITDKPIEVTLTESQLIIKDFGLGIPKDMIQPIYGVYGASTKKSDGRVTGGFGLGCKAPFAYTDHFEVVSCNSHIKTIYNMTKSDAETQGRPGIQEIMSLPTTEQGITVTINIMYSDRLRFEALIRKIAYNGAILTKLNNRVLNCLPIDQMENGYLITNMELVGRDDILHVRYGNVIYPFNYKNGDSLSELGIEVVRTLRDLPNLSGGYSSSSNWKICFQAEAHSLTITPSREQLSMTSHTIDSLKKLMADYLEKIKKKAPLLNIAYEILDKGIKKYWQSMKPFELLKEFNSIPMYQELDNNSTSLIFNSRQYSEVYLRKNAPSKNQFIFANIYNRLDTFKGISPKMAKAIKAFKHYDRKNYSRWLKRYIFWPIEKAMIDDKRINPAKLFVFGEYKYSWISNFVPYKDWIKHNGDNFRTEDALKFIRGFVILSYNKMNITDNISYEPAIKHWYGDAKGSFAYIVSRNPKKVEEARQFWKELGYYVLDMTKHQETVKENIYGGVGNAPVVPRKPKKDGLPILSCLLDDKGGIQTHRMYDEDAKRILKPEYIFKFSSKTNTDTLASLSATVSKAIITLYGNKGGLIQNSNQQKKWAELGAKPFSEYFFEKYLNEIRTNPRMRVFREYNINDAGLSDSHYGRHKNIEAMKLLTLDEDLAAYFGFQDPRTKEDKLMDLIYKEYRGEYTLHTQETGVLISEIEKEIKKISLNPEIEDLYKLVKSKYLADTLGVSTVSLWLNDNHNKKRKQIIRDFILEFLEA